jgi:hypothetical protein
MKVLALLFGATVGVQDVYFPKIPLVKRFKMPSLDDLMQEQAEIKKKNEVDQWRWLRHGP